MCKIDEKVWGGFYHHEYIRMRKPALRKESNAGSIIQGYENTATQVLLYRKGMKKEFPKKETL